MEKIKNGDLYKIINIKGKELEIRYGYYEEYEKDYHEPVPIYPDLLSVPLLTDCGERIVTAMQSVCERFEGGDPELGCFSCRHFKAEEDLIGICNAQNEINKFKGDKK